MQTASNDIKWRRGDCHERRLSGPIRAVAVGVTAVTVMVGAGWLLVVAWLTARARVDAAGPASTDELLALCVATLAIGIAGWLCLGVALEVLAHAPGRLGSAAGRWADRLTPALARRVAAFVLGVGVGVAGGPPQAVATSRTVHAVAVAAGAVDDEATGAGEVLADTPPDARVPADPGFVPTGPSAVLEVPTDPGFVPTGPSAGLGEPAEPSVPADPGSVPPAAIAPQPGFTPTAPRVRPQADPALLGARGGPLTDPEVVVHRGDSLWSLAARHLGPDAGDAEIAHAWPQWYAANRDRIGDDPDLLLPGQVLRVPGPHQSEGAPR